MMQINTGLGGMTMQTVKQLFGEKPGETAAAKQEQDPLSRIKALIGKYDGKPSYEALSAFVRLE